MEEHLHAGHGALINFVKATEPLLMPRSPPAVLPTSPLPFHLSQLLQIKTVFVEEQLHAGHGALINFVKATEPLLMPGAPAADAARVDRAAMESLTKSFYDTWRASIESINREVVQSFANFKLGREIIKQARWGERVYGRGHARVGGKGMVSTTHGALASNPSTGRLSSRLRTSSWAWKIVKQARGVSRRNWEGQDGAACCEMSWECVLWARARDGRNWN